jgi:acetyl-CoA acetyltransferase|tara:strand:+ start:1637 stop:2854 length:1218 start_codon:yes stop_codon:yes gene_type:complete
MTNPSMAAAIVGAAESDEIGFALSEKGTTNTMLHIEAISNVCKQVGISPSEIEGVFSAGFTPQIAEYLHIRPKYIDGTAVGGSSFELHVHHALAAIAAGVIDVALVSHGESGRSARKNQGRGTGGGGGGDPWAPGAAFSGGPYGGWGAPFNYAHAMTRHLHQWGSTKEDFAQIAVSARDWATLNPRAVMHSKETDPNGGPITVQDVLDSRLISWPLNLLDVCLVTDHGGAVLIVSAEKAHSFNTSPVWIAGAGESMGHWDMLEMDDLTLTSAVNSGKTAYQMAGMGPGEMELGMIYDSFTVTVGITVESLGLAPRGGFMELFEGGKSGPGGSGMPINTNGGGLSFSHSGMYGMMLLVEAYRQLSGTAEDGVNGIAGKQTSAQTAIVNGTGGSLSTTGTLVLVADQ